MQPSTAAISGLKAPRGQAVHFAIFPESAPVPANFCADALPQIPATASYASLAMV